MTSVGHEEPAAPVEFDWRHYTHDRNLPDVLDSALDVFVKLGYHGTSVRAIAAKAGLSVPGLYHYHHSKQEIFATLLRMSNDEVMSRSRHIALRDELEQMMLSEVVAASTAGDFTTRDPHEATRAVLVLGQGVAD
jgi:AcrR family transcriptional regulator